MKWLNAGKQRSKKANKLARGEDAYSGPENDYG